MKNKTLVLSALLILSLLCLDGSLARAKTPGKGGEGKLDDVVVKEKDTFKIEKTKTPVVITVDYMKAVLPTLETEKYFFDTEADRSDTDDLKIPFTMGPKEEIAPWLSSIIFEPAALFLFENVTADLVSWSLIITDSGGKPFRIFKGGKTVPESILWNGKGNKGNFMLAGVPYSYVFEAVVWPDKKITVIGKPFTVSAVVYWKNQLIIGLAPKEIFETELGGLGLSGKGKILLQEASDISKRSSGYPVAVKAYSKNKKVARAQAEMVRSHIAETLMIPRAQIAVGAYAAAPEKFQVEIVLAGKKRIGMKFKNAKQNQLVIDVDTSALENTKKPVPAPAPPPAPADALPGF